MTEHYSPLDLWQRALESDEGLLMVVPTSSAATALRHRLHRSRVKMRRQNDGICVYDDYVVIVERHWIRQPAKGSFEEWHVKITKTPVVVLRIEEIKPNVA